MIIVEEALKDLFATLPTVDVAGSSYAVNFDFGSHEDLLLYLRQKALEQANVYPLIWLETPIEKKGDSKVEIDLRLIIATLTNSEISNVERLDITFKPIIIPVLKNVIKALEQSGFTEILNPESKSITNFFNYGINEHVATDIWDAAKLQCKLQLTNSCKKNINY